MGWVGFMEIVTGEARAAPGTGSVLLSSVGVAAIVLIGVHDDAKRPDAAHPGQEGARALYAKGQHAGSVA
jgi:hypothetical protein